MQTEETYNDLDLAKVKLFVEELFQAGLPETMYFHNFNHTLIVLGAVLEIGLSEGLSNSDLKILAFAAIFHDTGYTEKYIGHEEMSISIAENFLSKTDLDYKSILKIKDCIFATKYPQFPRDILEQIICDADFYHFSMGEYQQYAKALKEEWQNHIGLIYSEEQWNTLNLEMLQNHEYFTNYAKQNWQCKKEQNIKNIQKELSIQ